MDDRDTTRILTIRITTRMLDEIDRRASANLITRNAAAASLLASGLRHERDAATVTADTQ